MRNGYAIDFSRVLEERGRPLAGSYPPAAGGLPAFRLAEDGGDVEIIHVGQGWNNDLDMSVNAVRAVLADEVPSTLVFKLGGLSKADLYGVRYESKHHIGAASGVRMVYFYALDIVLELIPEARKAMFLDAWDKFKRGVQAAVKAAKEAEWDERRAAASARSGEQDLSSDWIVSRALAGDKDVIASAMVYADRSYPSRERSKAFEHLKALYAKNDPRHPFTPGTSEDVFSLLKWNEVAARFTESVLLERPQDIVARAEASAVYNKVLADMKAGYYRWKCSRGSMGIPLDQYGAGNVDLVIQLPKEYTRIVKDGFGFMPNGTAAIFITYDTPLEISESKAEFDAYIARLKREGLESETLFMWFDRIEKKEAFCHEFTHWQDYKRSPRPRSASLYNKGDVEGYYNDDREMNAYYQELAVHYESLLRAAVARGKGENWFRVFAPNPQGFMKTIIDRMKHDGSGWGEHLTPENRKRVLKRATGLLDELHELWRKLEAA